MTTDRCFFLLSSSSSYCLCVPSSTSYFLQSVSPGQSEK